MPAGGVSHRSNVEIPIKPGGRHISSCLDVSPSGLFIGFSVNRWLTPAHATVIDVSPSGLCVQFFKKAQISSKDHNKKSAVNDIDR